MEETMHYFNKEFSRKTKMIVKRRRDEHALKNVVSLRISDEEMESLAMISRNSAKNISEILREAFKSWQANRRRLCLDI
jgi:hypothetical protein